jgi:hypothetical protein
MILRDYFLSPWTAGYPPGAVSETHFITAGCSHTSAVGIDINQSYTQLLANDLKMLGVNLGRPGGNHQVVIHNLTMWLRNNRPEFVIVQWPYPFRKLVWRDQQIAVLNIHDGQNPLFDVMLRYGEENFYSEWIQSILTITTLCGVMNIPCVHWSLYEIADEYHRILQDNDIVLHSNDENSTRWNQDHAARDQQHHSEKCHAQWAQKLKGLINELTAR